MSTEIIVRKWITLCLLVERKWDVIKSQERDRSPQKAGVENNHRAEVQHESTSEQRHIADCTSTRHSRAWMPG